MDTENLNQRLSQIQTDWTVVRQAHHGARAEIVAAQQRLIDRYGGAIKRYLLGAVRDPEAADELYQDFACRLLSGSLGGADPEHGRFRHFVKGVLYHLIADHHKRCRRRPLELAPNHPEPAVEPPTLSDIDRDLVASWRDELLARAWAALESIERHTGREYYTVLRFRADHADLSSPELAAQLADKLGRKVTAVGVRQTLHRAREKFAELVLDSVKEAMDGPTQEQLDQELIELGLLVYCQPALERQRRG
jgi:RNA polymerase sigma-70 factor (ECF subfamily)